MKPEKTVQQSGASLPKTEADQKLIKLVKEFMATRAMSMRQFCDSAKITSSVFSQWLSSKYPGDNHQINVTVERFLRIESQKVIAKDLKFVEIRNSRRIWGVLETAHADGVIGVVIGDTGTSKTMSVKQYCKDNDVIYLEANRTYRMPNEYLRKIHAHKKVGKDGRGSLNAMYNDVVEELRGTNTLIVIDQADYLNLGAIDVFRAISDEAGIGVVFVGLPSFLRKLRGNEPEVRQVRDRIKFKIELGSYSKEECDDILNVNWDGLNGLASEFFRYSSGSLRILSSLVYNARRIMANPKNQDKELNQALIARAAEYLEIRVA